MGRLRWGDDAPADADEARRRIVDAAERCIDRLGLSKTTVEDVATEAHVSRATVYRYFADRDELVLAMLLTVLGRSLDRGMDEFLGDAHTIEALRSGIVDSSVYLLDTIRTTPKLQALLSADAVGVTATIAGASQGLFRGYASQLHGFLDRAQSEGVLCGDLDVDDLAEWVLRAILSLLTVDGPAVRDSEGERAFLATFLAPALRSARSPS